MENNEFHSISDIYEYYEWLSENMWSWYIYGYIEISLFCPNINTFHRFYFYSIMCTAEQLQSTQHSIDENW